MPPDDNAPDRSGATFAFSVNDIRYRTNDQRLTGRDVLRVAGFDPASDYVLIWVLRPGTQSIGLDEQVDLGAQGPEVFRAFPLDRMFTFTVDERGYEWGAPTISEADLRAVTGVPEDKGFILDQADQPDREIHEGDTITLSERGTERLRTVRVAFTIIVNTEPKRVEGRSVSFDQLVRLAFETPPTGQNILITIDYGHGPPANPKGALSPGQSVKIKNRMVFDVTATDRS